MSDPVALALIAMIGASVSAVVAAVTGYLTARDTHKVIVEKVLPAIKVSSVSDDKSHWPLPSKVP